MEGMKYGYARVSTDDQNPALQLAALKNAGCKTVFKDDGLSGATTKRPDLLRCLKKLEHGDTLIVWKLDRVGRSLRDLITMLDGLKHPRIWSSAMTIITNPRNASTERTRAARSADVFVLRYTGQASHHSEPRVVCGT